MATNHTNYEIFLGLVQVGSNGKQRISVRGEMVITHAKYTGSNSPYNMCLIKTASMTTTVINSGAHCTHCVGAVCLPSMPPVAKDCWKIGSEGTDIFVTPLADGKWNRGNTGAPVICLENGYAVLQGISSHSGAYANVHSMRGWIEHVISKN